jgi:integrase
MATVHIYLDRRSLRGSEAQLKIGINKRGSSAYIPLGQWIHPNQWDSVRERVKEHPNRQSINSFIANRKTEVSNLLMRLTVEGELTKLSATQIKNRLMAILEPKDYEPNSLVHRFELYASTRDAASTKEKYDQTLKKILEYDSKARTLTFEDISKEWLDGFERFLMKCSPSKNGRNIHLRNIRAVFNDAIDNDITTAYPFRKFKIRPEATKKRSLTLSQLRELFNYPVEPYQQRYLDMFKLSFFLIGINVTDLCLLYDISPDGHLVYKRAKTKKMYSIKVEPEAMEIISRYRGKKHLLNLMDDIRLPRTFTQKFDRGLKEIGPVTYEPNPKWKPGSHKHRLHKVHHAAFPGLSSYWARHTWATIASELDIPHETISASLGHSITNKTTAIYIDYNMAKVDAANRKVIDYVLGKE